MIQTFLRTFLILSETGGGGLCNLGINGEHTDLYTEYRLRKFSADQKLLRRRPLRTTHVHICIVYIVHATILYQVA